jgi:hypothetical protein
MKKCKTESIHALNTDQQTSFDSSSSSSSSVSNIISTVFDYGLDLGGKYNIILDEKDNDDNINKDTSTNNNKNTPPKKGTSTTNISVNVDTDVIVKPTKVDVIKVHHHQAIQRQTRGRKTQGKDR